MNNHQHYDKYRRNPEAKAFYKSAAWLKCREVILIRDDYLCQECLKDKRLTPADLVHHIIEYKEDQSKALDEDNLVSICFTCHNKIHGGKGKSNEMKVSKKINVVQMSGNPEIF
ncbi:HNH endonuclease [Halobacillus shinanisalinarum]|uniref:Putative HNH nuclease YajD n=1 Tax=Halobacillus shinanisalinarum TaxID=2932258 RepID=A0ABY4GZE7_9BACI|nr:HNH endonuclease signature motif containing protein [Halobacillus shinanisalinarum]UOQ93406.1 HNH endonuclease [Halobacillus shinanisalinarum]